MRTESQHNTKNTLYSEGAFRSIVITVLPWPLQTNLPFTSTVRYVNELYMNQGNYISTIYTLKGLKNSVSYIILAFLPHLIF